MGIVPALLQIRNSNLQQRVLLVHLSEPLGDFVSRLKFINSICPKDSQNLIFLVVNQKFKSLEYLINPNLQIIYIKSAKYRFNPFYRYYILKKINALWCQTAVNISVDRGMFSDEITLNSGAKKKYTIKKKNNFLSSLFEKINNKKYNSLFENDVTNEYERIERLKSVLDKELSLHFPTANIQEQIRQIEDYIVIAPFASKRIQEWPLEKYITLLNKIKDFSRVVILGDINALKSELTNLSSDMVTNLVSQTNLKEAAEIIKMAALFIGNDSGLTHLAYYFDVPIVGIIGGGNYGQFFPHNKNQRDIFLSAECEFYGCRWKCKHPKVICLTNVSVEMAYNSVKNLLGK